MQTSIFDLVDGEQRKSEGIALVTHYTDAAYRQRLEAVIIRLASTGKEFTSDDAMEQAGPVPAGFSVNIVGAMMNACGRRGIITNTGRTRKTQRPTGHARRLMVWKGA